MRDNLRAIVNDILKKKEMQEINSVNPNQSLRRDLGFDSFDLAELTVRIEDRFGIDIFEDGIIDSIDEILEKLKCGQT